MRKPVIAIDGYSSTGKSSISKVIAKKLGLVHMDTGALYRGVTYFANTHYSDHNGEPDLEQLVKNLGKIKLEFRKEHDDLVLYLNGEDVSKAIRTNEVSQNVSLVAAKKMCIRDRMKGELEEQVKGLHFNKITIFQPGMLERKSSDRGGEVLGGKIIKFVNKFGLFESMKPLPTDVLAQAMINSSKIKSNGYSKIKLGSIPSFAEKTQFIK